MALPAPLPPETEEREISERHRAVFVCLSKLPPFRPAALKLLNLSMNDYAPIAEFELAFGSDPALTADLLLVANSAEFGLRSRIETIRHAVAYLGLDRVRSLACTIGYSFFVRNVPRTEFSQGLWAHSIATAVVASAVSARYSVPDLYTAGLMHDLGRLALLYGAGKVYANLFSRPFEDISEALTLEKEQFGLTHCDAGDMVAERWNFPPNLRAAIMFHHDPIGEISRDSACLIRASCLWAELLGFPEFAWQAPRNVSPLPSGVDPERLRSQIEQRIATFG